MVVSRAHSRKIQDELKHLVEPESKEVLKINHNVKGRAKRHERQLKELLGKV